MEGLKWEYKRLSPAEMMGDVELNALGDDGWELCSLMPMYGCFFYVFKRQISP